MRLEQENTSSLSAFTERPVPTEHEVNSFEKVVEREVRHQEIDSNLNEIYRDNKGGLVDVKRLKARRSHSIVVRVFRRLLVLTILGLAAYFAYIYFFDGDNNLNTIRLEITAPEQAVAGEEFSYLISYQNPTKFAITRLRLELRYPENFVMTSAEPLPVSTNNGFDLPDLPAGSSGLVTVTGKLIGRTDSVNVISARLNYMPANFSSEFKKEASDATIISGLGFKIALEESPLAFVGQDNELSFSFFDLENNYLDDFIIKFSLPEKVTLSLVDSEASATSSPEEKKLVATSDGISSWLISGLEQETSGSKLSFRYQIKEKIDSQPIVIRLEKRLEDGQSYLFWEKTLLPEIVKSDLNLTILADGSRNNNSANFGDTLEYILSYSNKGESSFKDAAIMAVLEGPLFNWNSLSLEDEGEIRTGRTIVWNKTHLPALAEVKPGDGGEIRFSIKLNEYQSSYFGEKLEVSAYAQYGVGEQPGADNRSNIIITRLNSDLSLQESIRYFDENNIPVGSGPLPPRVDEASSFRVYWTVRNNLHELSQAQVMFSLPTYVNWAGNDIVSAGNIYYDASRHAVIWSIGRLPVSVSQFDAAFNISLVPSESDRNKILVLSPGAAVTAIDNETQAQLSKKSGPKTTKLEDDDIASLNNSGRIE